MGKVLQNIEFNETKNTKEISIVYTIRSTTLDLILLKTNTKVMPTKYWSKGDKYVGKQRNPKSGIIEEIIRIRQNSCWEYETRFNVTSNKMKDHMVYLLDIFIDEPEYIYELMNRDDVDIDITFLKKTSDDIVDYEFDSNLFKKALKLSKKFIFINYTDC